MIDGYDLTNSVSLFYPSLRYLDRLAIFALSSTNIVKLSAQAAVVCGGESSCEKTVLIRRVRE